MFGIDWPSAGTQIVAAVGTIALTSRWWLKLAKPLATNCRAHMARARVERANAGEIATIKREMKAAGEQNAIIIDQAKVIMDALNIAVMQADRNGLANAVSDAWVELTGVSRDAAMGNGWIGRIVAADQPVVIAVLADVVDHDRPRAVEFAFANPDGPISVAATINPIVHGREIVAYRLIFKAHVRKPVA